MSSLLSIIASWIPYPWARPFPTLSFGLESHDYNDDAHYTTPFQVRSRAPPTTIHTTALTYQTPDPLHSILIFLSLSLLLCLFSSIHRYICSIDIIRYQPTLFSSLFASYVVQSLALHRRIYPPSQTRPRSEGYLTPIFPTYVHSEMLLGCDYIRGRRRKQFPRYIRHDVRMSRHCLHGWSCGREKMKVS